MRSILMIINDLYGYESLNIGSYVTHLYKTSHMSQKT